jgi:uncharacterized protein GlcG (DUF336 family)
MSHARVAKRIGRPAVHACVWRRYVSWLVCCVATAACSGGGSGGSTIGTDPTPVNCSGSCATATSLLTVNDVGQIIAQGVFEANARGSRATIAVVDRVGNVLAVYRLGMASGRDVLVATQPNAAGGSNIVGGLEGIVLPIDAAAAISKAVTGAYLSSEGNAFSSRTASQIVEDHFNPGEKDQPAGPLFGVQFSQLACSDFSSAFDGVGPDVGPKRSPLGLSADPGGFPLYKDGTVVGGVGVIADDLYSIDANITDVDRSLDEAIAYAATYGFSAPLDRRADRITVDGKTLRFSDVDFGGLTSVPGNAPGFATLTPADGALVSVNGYTQGTIDAGTAFGFPASGIRPDGGVDFPGTDAYVFVDDANVPRYPPISGTDAATLGPATLTEAEVRSMLRNALGVASHARAQIRRPDGSIARVTISVVDTNGVILGMVRSRDAPVFGADVSLQKARTAALFSSSSAAAFLDGLPDAVYLDGTTIVIGDYVTAVQAFFSDPNALETGSIAFTDRANGNISRPYFPDGLDGRPPGPFSKPPGQWSPFSTGLQYDLVNNSVLQHVKFILGLVPGDVGQICTGAGTNPRIANGVQIFPGSAPIYRGDTLVGGIGVSGDGVDQDDMVAFLGLHNAGVELGGAIGNAPAAMRADTLTPHGVRLRYVQCPQAPFVDSTQTDVCAGK